MRDKSRTLRDRLVRLLARISLIGVLALMGALFIGSAAVGGTTDGTDATSITDGQPTQQNQQGVLDDARPMGLMVGAVVIGGGLVVLMIGAFRPPSRREQRAFAELLRQ